MYFLWWEDSVLMFFNENVATLFKLFFFLKVFLGLLDMESI